MDKIKQKFQVAVRCMTYNHSKYITDTMNGFAMQQTNFPFVCMIVDDASTDGEQEVIKQYIEHHFDYNKDGISYNKQTEYAEIIFARHKTNKNCYFAVLFLKENHYSKKKTKEPYLKEWQDEVEYIAYCEGDDYWIDCKKLQRQFDILNNNNDISMVYTNFKTVDKDGNDYYWPGISDKFSKYSKSGNIFFELLKVGTFVSTHTCCVSKKVINSDYYKLSPNKVDYNLFLAASAIGNVYYINDIMGCYRKTPGSAVNAHHSMVNRLLEEVYKYYLLIYLSNQQIFPKGRDAFIVKLMAMKKALRELVHGNSTFFREMISKSTKMYMYIPLAFLGLVFAKFQRK